MMSSFQKAVQHQTWPILPLVLMAQITCQLCISATGLVLSSVIGKLTRIFVTIVILFFAISGHSQSVKNTVKRKPMSRYSTLTQRVSESSPLLGIKDAQYPFIHIYVGNSVPTQTFMRDVLVAVPTIHLFLWRYKGIYRLMGKSDNLEQDLKTIQKNVAPDAYIWTLEQEDLSDHLSPEYVMDISNIDEFKSDGQRELAQTLMEIEAGGANTAALKSVALSRIGPYVEKEVSSLVQNALGSFGTADVDVDFGPDFSPKNGQIEVFLPFFTNDNSTWFAQSGVVFNEKARYEGRTFAHAGIGYRRQLSKNIMWGVNGFYDVDLIKQHKRASLGLEEWIENYKLSMNYYFPLSGWKSTDAMTDHLHSIEERPVSGFDLRGEGYLPNYPQWSAEVYYDQKLGDLVGASNDSQPRKNPYSLGFNINYTPMPLIELYSGYQYEKGAGNDFQLGIKFHYHFGKSLQSHLSNDKDLTHSNLRKSMLSRAVKRNANIGLEYRYIPFSFQLEQNHITVKEGQTIHVSDYYSVHGVQNLQRFVLEVRGSDDMSDPSTRTEVQSSQYISDLTYDMEGDQIQSTKVITIIAHLRNGRHVVSPSMHISVLASDDHNAIDIQDKEDPMTVASVKRAKESMGSDQNSEVIDPELEGNAQTDSQHLALDEGSDVKSDMSGEEPTSSSQIEGEVSEQKETLTLGKVVQNVQPAPLDEAPVNVQATNLKVEGNTQPAPQLPVLDKGDVPGGMTVVSGEEPTSSGQNAEDKGSEQKETLTLGKVVQNVQPAPLDEASMNVQATNPKAEGNTQPDRQPPVLDKDDVSGGMSDVSGEEPTSSGQNAEDKGSEQEETLASVVPDQNVQPAPLDEAPMSSIQNGQATNPKAEGNTQPAPQPPVLDKDDVSGGMSGVSGEDPMLSEEVDAEPELTTEPRRISYEHSEYSISSQTWGWLSGGNWRTVTVYLKDQNNEAVDFEDVPSDIGVSDLEVNPFFAYEYGSFEKKEKGVYKIDMNWTTLCEYYAPTISGTLLKQSASSDWKKQRDWCWSPVVLSVYGRL